MKFLKILFVVCMLLITHVVNAQPCTPAYSAGCSFDAIQYFSLKGESGSVIYNNTGACTASYTNYTASFSPVNLAISNSYSGFLRTQDVNNYVSIWIDQNNNNTFESTERILNNLKIGPVNVLYSIYIPPTFALGLHRMRVRNVYYFSAPATATDPCSLYTYGETEDYQVNITNAPGARSIAAGIPGSCVSSSVTTMDASSNNSSGGPVYLLDSSNNIFAGVYPNSNNLGRVSASIYVHNGSVRQAPNGSYYLNRNINLASANLPSTTVNLRLAYKNTELNALIAQPGSGVTSQFDLTSTRNTDGCLSALGDPFGTQVFPTGFGSLSSDRFLDLTSLTSFGAFYFSGPSLISTCPVPLSPGVELSTSSSGTVVWSVPSGAPPSGYQWTVTSSATPPASGSFTTTTAGAFSGLTAGQIYYAHVRSVCGPSYSNWVTYMFASIINDQPCGARNIVANTSAICDNSTNALATNTLAINDPAISCSAPNNTLWYKFTPTSSGQYTLRVTIPPTGDPLHGWVSWFTVTGECHFFNFTQYPSSTCYEFGQTGNGDSDDLLSPVLTAGVTYYIMIDGFSGDYGNFCLQILSAAPPPCSSNVSPPNGATNVAIPGGAVNLSWTAVAGATQYEVYLGTSDPPAFYSVVSANTLNAGVLHYNQTYYWYVVPYVSGNPAVGCISTKTSFTTVNPTNCIPLYTQGCSLGDSITYFSLKGESGSVIYNNTGSVCAAAPNLSYSNYTGSFSPVMMSTGDSYSGFIRTGNPNDYISIWIDFNDNGYFEDSERLLNNLNAGTTKLLYSISIPLSSPLGTHRLRVRNIYSPAVPFLPTHPCDPYTKGETEDYMATITNSPGTRSVAPGVAGTCQVSSVTTIDAASNNLSMNGVKLLDSLNRYVCSIYPDGNAFGRTSANYYVHSGAVRMSATGNYYLNRNLHLNVDVQPATNYRLRMYYRNTELNALIAQAGSGVTSQFDLGLLQNPDACSNAMSAQPFTRKSPTGFGAISGDRLIDFVNLTSANGFYLLKDCFPTSGTYQATACAAANPSYVWNGNTYTASGNYTATFTNAGGCDSVVTLNLTLGTYPQIGTASANPASVCIGSPVNLSYQSCATQLGFSNHYAPINWITGITGNSNGTITPFAPDSIVMVSSDGLSGDGATQWSIIVPCNGTITFDWNYSTVDGPMYDYPRYSINGGAPQVLPGYSTGTYGLQSGSAGIMVSAGDLFVFDIYSVDNIAGSCTATIKNFSAPTNSTTPVTIYWYGNMAMTNYLGSGNNLSINPSVAGNYIYYAQVADLATGCANPTAIPTNFVTVTAGPCNATLDLTMVLQGYSSGGGFMSPVLYNQGVSANSSIVDNVEIQLRNPVTNAIVASALPQLGVNGIVSCSFNVLSGNYYIVVRHRNSVETWSAAPVWFSPGTTTYYNFTSSQSQAYGNNLVEVSPFVWAIYSGDLNQEENVDLLDASILETDINNFSFGYFASDINGDGNVDLLDSPVLETNINNFIYSVHP